MALSSILLLFITTLLLPFNTLSEAEMTKTYIIRTRSDLKPSVFPTLHHWYSTTLTSLSTSSLRSEQNPQPTPNILHIYKHTFHGFSAVITTSLAALLQSQPFVLSVLPDRTHELHTTRSSLFLGLLSSNSHLLADSNYGENVVVAVLDSGINPKHRSFGDDGIGPVPPRWNGTCEKGPSFPAGSCNRKLIGARFFHSGFKVWFVLKSWSDDNT